MMVAIIVVSHGALAEALLGSAEGILGPQTCVMALGLAAGESPRAFSSRLGEALDRLGPCEGVLVLADLWGGAPCSVAVAAHARDSRLGDYRVLGGANLGMLLEALTGRESGVSVHDLARRVLGAGVAGIQGFPDGTA